MDGAGFLLTIFTDLKTKQNNTKLRLPCGVGYRFGSDPVLLWLWHRPNCSSDSIPGTSTSICHTEGRYGRRKGEREKERKRGRKEGRKEGRNRNRERQRKKKKVSQSVTLLCDFVICHSGSSVFPGPTDSGLGHIIYFGY